MTSHKPRATNDSILPTNDFTLSVLRGKETKEGKPCEYYFSISFICRM